MKHTLSAIILTIIFILLMLLSCTPSALPPTSTTISKIQASELTAPQDWTPPVFPGAVMDEEIRADMTAVAATPEALNETASNCFGFSVHNAIFHAYRSNASVQDVLDFYSEQMAAQGWKKIPIHPADSSMSHLAWQWGANGPLVAYAMVVPMEEGRTLIYLSIAESDSPQTIMEE